jgi:hypothetical protein
MSRTMMVAGALALLAGGCATSADTERRAQAHDTRARQAAAYEDYDHAAMEKHEGDRLHAKAAAERANEAAEGEPVPPPPPPEYVPPPPPPPSQY